MLHFTYPAPYEVLATGDETRYAGSVVTFLACLLHYNLISKRVQIQTF
jgi:hypothetical protein